MTLKEIMERCEGLRVYERRNSDELRDVRVFYNEDIGEWDKIFNDILGHPIKPAGVNPTEDDVDLTKNYGGIWSNQTLFKKEFNEITVMAMLLPWQDDIHTTLKTVILEKQ